MNIPEYPEYTPVSIDLRPVLHPALAMQDEGISEFTFANLYLFRNTYHYRLSRLDPERIVISGTKDEERFIMLPCGFPEDDNLVKDLLGTHNYAKGLSEKYADTDRIRLERLGYRIEEDRDNFDYLYLKSDLAALEGRKFHKKRNLVNAFINNYSYSESPICGDNLEDALTVLEQWKAGREDPGDYDAAREALELRDILGLHGYLVRVDGVAAAYTLGEPLQKGRAFAVHFEKAVGNYKGIYQFINRAFASVLPRHYKYINREQDLGDEGLRQAKMTYRPFGFIKKYRAVPIPN